MNVMYMLSLAGVAVFAISGALAAGRKQFDVFGVLVIAVVTAIGGGTIRDLLLDRNPVFWIEDTNYLSVTSIAAVLTILLVRYGHPPARLLLIADGLGLALFTISGTQIAESTGASHGVSILMGCITGVAGGVLRDVLSNDVPLLLRDREIYATAAISGSIVYIVLLKQTALTSTCAAVIGMAVIVILRFLAIWWRVRVPLFKVPEETDRA